MGIFSLTLSQKTRKKPSLFYKVFFVPVLILRLFRMWVHSDRINCCFHWTANLFWLAIFLPATVICGGTIAETVNNLLKEGPETPILKVFSTVPHLLLSLRGVITMFRLSYRSFAIVEKLNATVDRCIPAPLLERLTKKWFILSTVLSVYCYVTVGNYYALNWLHGIVYTQSNITTMKVMYPYVDAIPIWAYIGIQVTFICFPYFLSQLLMVIMVVSATIILDCSRAVETKLEHIQHETEGMLKVDPRAGGLDVKVAMRISGELEELMTQRAWLFQLVEVWNRDFGTFMLLFYVSDFAISAGNLAVVVTGAEQSPLSLPAKGFGTINFAIYATAFYIPFALASEKAIETGDTVYAMTMSLYPAFLKFESLRKVLNDFRGMIVSYPVHFSAAEFFYVDRHRLVATVTLLVSFGVIFVEFTHSLPKKDEEHGHSPPTVGTNTTLVPLLAAL